MAGGGFSIRVGTNYKASQRRLRKIQHQFIPAAQKSAMKRATISVVADVATKIAAGMDVPRWMIRGTAGGDLKAGGSRLGRTGWINKLEGALVFLRHTHINPTGTERRQNAVTPLKRGGIRVAGVRRTYPDGFLIKTRWAHGRIYTRDGDTLKPEVIQMGDWAKAVLRNRASVVGARVFRERFRHELRRRLKTRGT